MANSFTGAHTFDISGTTINRGFEVFTGDSGTTNASYAAICYGGAGAGFGGGQFHGGAAQGTQAIPAAAIANQMVSGFGGIVYTGAAWTSSSPASCHYVLLENATPTAHGACINWYTTAIGSAAAARVNLLTATPDGTVWVKDGATYSPTDTVQTKPHAGVKFIVSGTSGSSTVNAAAVVAYGGLSNSWRGYAAAGTPTSPTGTAAGAQLLSLLGYGYASGGWSASSNAAIIMSSAEAGVYSTGNTGSKITVGTTPVGSGARVDGSTFQPSGGFSVGATASAADPGIGAINADRSIKSIGATYGIGYGTGAGGAVTQATSKSTGVTLNNVCGQITMNNASLASGISVAFTVTNSAIAATDTVLLNIASGATATSYLYNVTAVAAGSCRIEVRNYNAGALAEALVLNFAVIKAVAA